MEQKQTDRLTDRQAGRQADKDKRLRQTDIQSESVVAFRTKSTPTTACKTHISFDAGLRCLR